MIDHTSLIHDLGSLGKVYPHRHHPELGGFEFEVTFCGGSAGNCTAYHPTIEDAPRVFHATVKTLMNKDHLPSRFDRPAVLQ